MIVDQYLDDLFFMIIDYLEDLSFDALFLVHDHHSMFDMLLERDRVELIAIEHRLIIGSVYSEHTVYIDPILIIYFIQKSLDGFILFKVRCDSDGASVIFNIDQVFHVVL